MGAWASDYPRRLALAGRDEMADSRGLRSWRELSGGQCDPASRIQRLQLNGQQREDQTSGFQRGITA